jgi:hypothetical protein
MLRIINTLKGKTTAKIALVSLLIPGEDLESIPNHLIKDYNALLKDIANGEQITYLPVYERREEYLREVQQGSGRHMRAEVRFQLRYSYVIIYLDRALTAFPERTTSYC